MRKTTLSKPADPAPGTASDEAPAPIPRGRRTTVRNRLLVGVALSSVAVLAAGAPAVYSAGQDLSRSQQLLEEAELAQRAVSLSHTLADERDVLVLAGAVGTDTSPVTLDENARSRADRRIAELGPLAPPDVAEALAGLPAVRAGALAADSDPLATYSAYTVLIGELDAVTRSASRNRPERAVTPVSQALPDLARAVDSSAATRALLVAALSGGGEQRELTGLAQRTHARGQAALADFTETAGSAGSDVYQRTVTGPEVGSAEERLAVLTAQPYLTEETRKAAEPGELSAALTARTELQRGVLSSLAAAEVQGLRDLRDSDLTALQLRIALLAAALLLAVGVSVRTARSLTRPLAAVRLGSRRVAADPAGQDPVRYTGRNDEFAEVIASVNALHARAAALHRQATEADADRGGLQQERGELAAERDRLRGEQRELSSRLAALHGAVHGTFAHHAQRILALVGEQLSVIEGLEEHETDPDQLATLFALDHLAARVRRHGENLLLLSGAERGARPTEPVALVDVLRAAVSEIERYELVEMERPVPPLRITGLAARDLGHLLAELLDNATAFSPAGALVRMAGREDGGDLRVTVTDDGIGMTSGRLSELNERLADPGALPPPGADGDPGIGMGLYTVARLVARYGLRARLHARPEGGIRAEVTVPATLLSPGGGVEPVPASAEHARAPEPEAEPAADPDAEHDRPAAHTDAGLPVRTPEPSPEAGSRPEPSDVDPEDLRRLLGAFQRGAREGHRDAVLPAERGGPDEEVRS